MSNDLQPDNFSKENFRDVLKASYLPQKQASSYLEDKYGYTYDPSLSSMEQKVYVTPSGQPIISERGSKRVSDFAVEDLNIATGGFFKTPRIKQAEQLAKATQEKYGLAPTIVGHSLGGFLAEQGAKKTPNSQVYTYNKAAGIPSAFYERPKNQTDYRTALDIPSALSAFQSGGTSKTLIGNLFSPIASHDIKYLR